MCVYIYIYIYINAHAVEIFSGPMFDLFLCQKDCSIFFFCSLVFEISFSLQKEEDKKTKIKNYDQTVVLNTGPRSLPNILGPVLNTTLGQFLTFFFAFLCFSG